MFLPSERSSFHFQYRFVSCRSNFGEISFFPSNECACLPPPRLSPVPSLLLFPSRIYWGSSFLPRGKRKDWRKKKASTYSVQCTASVSQCPPPPRRNGAEKEPFLALPLPHFRLLFKARGGRREHNNGPSANREVEPLSPLFFFKKTYKLKNKKLTNKQPS